MIDPVERTVKIELEPKELGLLLSTAMDDEQGEALSAFFESLAPTEYRRDIQLMGIAEHLSVNAEEAVMLLAHYIEDNEKARRARP